MPAHAQVDGGARAQRHHRDRRQVLFRQPLQPEALEDGDQPQPRLGERETVADADARPSAAAPASSWRLAKGACARSP